MKWFTVEVTLRSVVDDDWTRHLSAVDAVPGTMLLQDAEEPMLVFPVEAEEPLKAARFVEGVLSIIGLRALAVDIADMPDTDFEVEDDDEESASAPTDVERRVNSWIDDTPALPGAHEHRELIH